MLIRLEIMLLSRHRQQFINCKSLRYRCSHLVVSRHIINPINLLQFSCEMAKLSVKLNFQRFLLGDNRYYLLLCYFGKKDKLLTIKDQINIYMMEKLA